MVRGFTGLIRTPTRPVCRWLVTSYKSLLEELAAGTPRIEALSTLGNRSLLPPLRKPKPGVVNKLQVVSMTLQPGEDLIVGRRIREVLNKARKARA